MPNGEPGDAARRAADVDRAVREARVSTASIEWAADATEPGAAIDIEVDGRRLWSEHLPEPLDGRRVVSWPAPLRPYLRGSGTLRVRASGGPVIAEGRYRFARERRRSLRRLAEAGTVLDKWGKLVPAANQELHDALLDGTERIVGELQAVGFVVAITGGTLLGAVRSGDILERDDDSDLLLYLGEASPTEVSLASYRVERLLIASGHTVIRHSDAHLQIMLQPTAAGISAHVDVFMGFHDRGVYSQPIHVRGDLPVEAILPITGIRLGGREVPSVADPEAWLAACYGPTWRVPDPAFSFETPIATRRRFENWFGTYDFTRHFWEARAARGRRGRRARGRGADVRHILRRTRRGDSVLDVGAGRGAAAAVLAGHRRRVTAIDFATTAVEAAVERSRGRFDVERVNLADGRAVLDLISRQREPEGTSVLLRDVLAYLPEDSRANVFRLIRAVIGERGIAVATFPDRATRRYEHLRPDTWHLPLSWLSAELHRHGLAYTLHRRTLRRTSAGVRRFVHISIHAAESSIESRRSS
ncbi:hypothetical protein [Agromyces sp. NPDC058110]|uniref:hypothetical protein n=1 Tax=Agromyces sp. NPDC058110 TaxID=3346345 RepID=UPI0036DCDC16